MPSDTEQRTIAERLERLEKQMRRLKKASLTLLISFAVAILMGQTMSRPRIVEAEKFVLKDANGNIRGWMGVLGNGSELTLGNSDRQPMITLKVSTDSGDLHFYGSPRSGMNVGLDSGEPSITMIDAANSEAEITLRKDGPSLSLHDGKGFSAIVGAAQMDDPVHKSMYTSAASFLLQDSEKKVLWRAP